MNCNLLSTGHVSRVAQDVTVSVCCGQSELPLWQAKAICQKVCRCNRILGWQHVGRTLGNLSLNSFDGCIWSVTTHRTGVTQAEVGVVIAVDIGEVRALGVINVDWKRPRPLGHPDHRHTLDHRPQGPLVFFA